MQRKRTVILAVLLLSGIVGLAAVTLVNNKQEVEAAVYRKAPDSRVLVSAITLKERQFTTASQYLGEFEPIRKVVISAESAGKLVKLSISEGDFVRVGQVIGQLDTDLLQAQRSSAQASRDNARLMLARYQNAATGEGIAKTQVDNAQLQFQQADAQLRQLDKQLSQSTIRAPFSGYINAKYAEIGSVVAPGAQIAELIDLSTLRLRINVPEGEVGQFRIGQRVAIKSDRYPARNFQGQVDFVAASADAAHQYAVKIALPNPSSTPLKAGMYGSVALQRGSQEPTLLIPRSALIGSAQAPRVYVVADSVAQLRSIRTGRTNAGEIEVVSGLRAGDRVVTSGQINLSNNTPVRLAQ